MDRRRRSPRYRPGFEVGERIGITRRHGETDGEVFEGAERARGVAAPLAEGPAAIFALPDVVVCLVDRRRRSLHDHLAGTVVVED